MRGNARQSEERRIVRRRWRRGAALAIAGSVSLLTAAVAWAAKGELSFNERVPEYDVQVASGVASSPDGNNLYVTGVSQITVLSRTAATGAFSYVETERDGVDDPSDAGALVNGLGSASGVAVSADGKHVYATGRTDDSVAVFARDSTTGKLSFVEAEFDGVNDGGPGGAVAALFGPLGVAVSADGESVYAVTGFFDNSVVAFARNATTGELDYLESEVDGVNDGGPGGTVDGMLAPTGVAVAPDSEGVYVTTSTDDSLVAFARDTGTGELDYLEFEKDGVGGVNGLNNAHAVTVAAGNNAVFATGGSPDNAVAVFDRNTTTEELSFIEAEVQGVDDTDPNDTGPAVAGMLDPQGLAISPNGLNVYVASEDSNAVAVFRWVPGDSELSFREAETNGANDGGDPGGAVTGLSLPRALAVSPDGDHVYVGGVDDPGLAAFSRQAGSPTFGSLSFLLSAPAVALRDPRGVAVAPDGNHVFVATNGDESLRSFSRNATTGAVSLVDTETEGVNDASDSGGLVTGLNEPKAVAVSPDGAHVYVTDTSTYSIGTYTLNAATGELSFVEIVADPDGGGHTGPVDGLYEPWDVVISPSGTGVYAAANSADGVSAFTRNPATGKLTFVEAEFDGVGGVDGLERAEAVAISPDGNSVYVAGSNDDAAGVFSRDTTTNALTFLEVERQGVNDGSDAGGTVNGLDSGPQDVVVSRNGAHVYFLSSTSIAVFDRDAATGRLSFSEVERNGVDDPGDAGGAVDGLTSGRALAISRDGGEVYAGGRTAPGSLLTFSRDKATGKLSFLEVERGGVDDPSDAGARATGLAGIEDLVVAPDDRHLYGVAENDNALTIWDREDDFVAPDTTIADGPAEGATITDPTPSFTFTSNESPATFACSVDGGAAATCPAELPALNDGAHSLSVAAIDAEGNADPTPATRSFTVDATAPDTSITGGPSAPTRDAPSFSFTSTEGGSSFECQIDGEAFGACSSPKSYSSLTDAEHTFRVRATDGPGNVDQTPAIRTFTLDTKVDGVEVTAEKKQKQKGEKIKVKVDVEAAEAVTATAEGTIEVPKGSGKRKTKTYKLAEISKDLVAGAPRTLKLKPKNSKDKRKIADALADRKKVKAKLTITLVDAVGNELVESKSVKLKRK